MRASPFLRSSAIPQGIENLIQIKHATFYRQHPAAEDRSSSDSNPPLFRDLAFELPAKPLTYSETQQHWALIGASGTTTFLEILRGTHLCFPPSARSFPYLSSKEISEKDHRLRTPSRAIQYVGFNGGKGQGLGSGVRGAYLSARYESRREETDWSVLQYLKGETELNPATGEGSLKEGRASDALLGTVLKDLRLEKLASMPVSNLSNGQTRRARIAKALLGQPELLLLDEPFMGLDPPTLVTLSPILRDLAYKSAPRLLLALRPQDPIPDWITHLAILGHNHIVALMGARSQVLFALHRWKDMHDNVNNNTADKMAAVMTEKYGAPPREAGYSLSSKGISKYNDYEEAKATTPAFFGNEGIVDDAQLSRERRDDWIKARNTAPKDRTLEQLLCLTATLPARLEGVSNLNGQHLQQENASTSDKYSSPNSDISSGSSLSIDSPLVSRDKPLIELSGVEVKYGSKVVLGAGIQPIFPDGSPNIKLIPGLYLTIYRGSRLALLGPNGSGKTTLLSLLTSDHPHSYSLPIKFFGRTRLPTAGKPGLSLWDIQSRVGHSSPEIHAFFPRHLRIRRVLESAWADTFAAKPKLNSERKNIVDAFLRWWEPELKQPPYVYSNPQAGNGQFVGDVSSAQSDNPVAAARAEPIIQLLSQCYPPFLPPDFTASAVKEDDLAWAESPTQTFGSLSFPTQRLLLLLRAVIKCPDIIILDEALSGLSAEVREKAMLFLKHGEKYFLQRRLVESPNSSGERARTVVAGWSQPGGGTTTAGSQHFELAEAANMRPLAERVCKKLGFSSPQALLQQEWLSLKKGSSATLSTDSEDQRPDLQSVMTHEQDLLLLETSEFIFSGLTDQQALVVVSHVREEIPDFVDEWVRLPGEEEISEHGRGVEMGKGEMRSAKGWARVWGWD